MLVKKDSNTYQVLCVSVGSFVSFSFAIISSMILSRYLSKVEYGTYKQVMYIYSTLLTFFTLGLPQAFGYFLPRIDLSEGKNLVNKITRVFFLLGGLFSICLFISSDFIALVLNNPNLEESLKIFSPIPFFLLPTLGIESIYATYRKTYISAIYTIFSRILMLCFVVLPVIFINGACDDALLGMTISSFFSFIIALYLKNMPYKKCNNIQTKIKYKDIFRFSLPLMYAGIWGIIISSADQFFISRYYGTTVFAEFSNGAMELPFIGMIISACSTVLFPLFSKMANEKIEHKNTIYPIWMSTFEKTVKLAYPILFFCLFNADSIMVLLYGEAYIISSSYFRVKLITNFFNLIAYYPIILAIGKTKFYANIHFICAILIILLDVICVHLCNQAINILFVSVFIQFIKTIALLYVISLFLDKSVIKLFPIKLILKITVPSILFFMIYNAVCPMINIINLVLSGIIYCIFYYIISRVLKIEYYSIIKPLLNR